MERGALRWLAEQVSSDFELVYLQVDAATQARRIARRWAEVQGETYPIGEAELATAREALETPDADEMTGRSVPGLPPGWPGWLEWAQDRWPSLTLPAPRARQPRTL